MQLGKGGKSLGKNKIIIIVAGVVILGVALFFVKNMFGGSADTASTDTATSVPASGAPGSDPMEAGQPSSTPGNNAAPATTPGTNANPGTATPAPQPAAAPAPASSPQPAAQPSAQSPRPAGQAGKASSGPTRQIKVFGNVNVTYPSNWRIKPGIGNVSAEFTNGVATLEMFPPDPKSKTAQNIAESVRKQFLAGSVITGQGACKVANKDAYWISVKHGGKVKRIVGINAPTMIGIVESANGGQLSSYRATFDKIENGMTF